MVRVRNKSEREAKFASDFSLIHHLRHLSATSPITVTSLVSRCMLDELRSCTQNTNGAQRTMYLPELDMEIVIPPPTQVPRRELPAGTPCANSRVKLLRTSAAFGGVSFPRPCPLPKPPRWDRLFPIQVRRQADVDPAPSAP